MFTGLVEQIGIVDKIRRPEPSKGRMGTTLTITQTGDILKDCKKGDSISVNGACLTVTAHSVLHDYFEVDVAPETLRRTNLGELVEKMGVNLEPAVKAETRMGGHLVQGHVDTIATIVHKKPDGNAINYRFEPKNEGVLKYIVEKGFICLDGASLTITKVDETEGFFEIMLIPYSQEKVVLKLKEVGESVNVEVDQIGKYVENSVHAYFEEKVMGKGQRGEDAIPQLLERMINRAVDKRLQEMLPQMARVSLNH